jgi:hypothetical protein
MMHEAAPYHDDKASQHQKLAQQREGMYVLLLVVPILNVFMFVWSSLSRVFESFFTEGR